MSRPEPTTDDIYCELILSGRLPVDILVDTGTVLAFRHTKPIEPFHAVVIPRAHVRNLVELEDTAIVAEIFAVIRSLVVTHALEDTAFRVVTNGGEFQESKHLHFHVLSPSGR